MARKKAAVKKAAKKRVVRKTGVTIKSDEKLLAKIGKQVLESMVAEVLKDEGFNPSKVTMKFGKVAKRRR